MRTGAAVSLGVGVGVAVAVIMDVGEKVAVAVRVAVVVTVDEGVPVGVAVRLGVGVCVGGLKKRSICGLAKIKRAPMRMPRMARMPIVFLYFIMAA